MVVGIGARKYKIKRKMEKYTKRLKGKETEEAKMVLDFSAVDGEEEISLNGETRNDTDANIRRIFGTKDDFLMTSFCSHRWTPCNLSIRGLQIGKRILSKFLDLEVFENKYRLAHDDSSHIQGALKQFEDTTFEEDLGPREDSNGRCRGRTSGSSKGM